MASKPISRGRRNAFAAIGLVAIAVAATTARADSIFDLFIPDANPYIVQNNLARLGFVRHSALARRGDVYLCDVVDRYGAPQRLVIDAHSGRILERFALRPYAWEEARRVEPRPRAEIRDWDLPVHPEGEVPVPATRPNVIQAFPEAPAPRQGQMAYGEGHAATPAPDAKPVEKPKLKLAHPKHLPTPAASDLPLTATVTPSASDSAAQPPATTQVAPTPAMQQPAAARPATLGVAAAGAAVVPAAKSPPAPKTKAINDIPVAPLD